MSRPKKLRKQVGRIDPDPIILAELRRTCCAADGTGPVYDYAWFDKGQEWTWHGLSGKRIKRKISRSAIWVWDRQPTGSWLPDRPVIELGLPRQVTMADVGVEQARLYGKPGAPKDAKEWLDAKDSHNAGVVGWLEKELKDERFQVTKKLGDAGRGTGFFSNLPRGKRDSREWVCEHEVVASSCPKGCGAERVSFRFGRGAAPTPGRMGGTRRLRINPESSPLNDGQPIAVNDSRRFR